MRTMWLTIVISGWLFTTAWAGGPTTRCLDAGSNETFPVSEGLTEEQWFAGRLPSIDYDAKGRPTGLEWGEVPAGQETLVERIGDYRGGSIYRCTYRQKNHPDGSGPSFDLIVYGYLSSKDKQHLVRPFCIVPNDEILGVYDDYFESSPREPFALVIADTLKGTGTIYNHYVFAFTAREASLRERSEGGRHTPQRTYKYNRAGKIVSTKSAGRD